MGKKDLEFPKLTKSPMGFMQAKEQESCDAAITDDKLNGHQGG